jgi:hypothetical protein
MSVSQVGACIKKLFTAIIKKSVRLRMSITKTQAYYTKEFITTVKSFKIQPPEPTSRITLRSNHSVGEIFSVLINNLKTLIETNTLAMFVERQVCYSAWFINLVRWHAGAVSFPLSDIMF